MIYFLIFTIVGASLAISEGWHELFDKSLKPFSCSQCMSLWIGVAFALMLHDWRLAFIPYLTTRLINKIIWI